MSVEYRSICALLQVFDMPASLAFYRDTLGFEIAQAAPPLDQVRGDDFDWVWLRRDGANLMLNTAYDPDAVRPPTPDPARVAAHDDTGLFIACPDVESVYDHLRARGITVEPPKVAPYGMRQLYVKDPDGFTVCFQWPAEITSAVPNVG
jgi:catechol 2,3-dioxygenase-like lactoylglutathione lyase family enzyme